MSNPLECRAWVEVDLAALRANFETVRRVVGPRVKIIAMVKANGYGLGAVRVVRALEPLSPWAYGVATAEEGLELRREAGIERPILVAGPLPPDAARIAVEAGLVPSVSDLAGLERLANEARRRGAPLEFHVEIDTGMGRSGFDWRDAACWSEAVRAATGPGVRWTGVFTHFHSADAPDRGPTQLQWERFQDALVKLPVPRRDLVVHAANSAAAVRWPEYAADAVRPGIYLYGGHPAPGVAPALLPPPQPVASVRARITFVRDVPPGSTTGYGATYAARGRERWGTLAIGYGDGLPRCLGNVGHALVRGRRVPIIGRISMDMTVVDLTDVPEAQPGDVATLIGRDGEAEITVDEVAAQAGTISYEILTGLTARLPRVVRRDDDID
ncbi:MAG TPA: alanine racemase [Longimicrobiales bacterium]|nr:alanine racemase [Longimicrobiales bacterium]